MEIQFEDLDKSDFFIDCIYKGGKARLIMEWVLKKCLG